MDKGLTLLAGFVVALPLLMLGVGFLLEQRDYAKQIEGSGEADEGCGP